MHRNRKTLTLQSCAISFLKGCVCLKAGGALCFALAVWLLACSPAFAAGKKGRGVALGVGGGNAGGNGGGVALGVGGGNAGGNGGGVALGVGGGNAGGNGGGVAWGKGGAVSPSMLDGLDGDAGTMVPFGQYLQDQADDKMKWIDDKPVDLGDLDKDLNEYIKRLDPIPGPAGRERAPEKKVKDQEPNGGAIGWRQKRDERAGQPEAGKDGRPPGFEAGAPDPGSYARREVLAVNLSPQGAARARTLGFAVGPPSSPTPEGAVSVLTAPEGVDAIDALARLGSGLPGERFHLNRVYRLFRPATTRDGSEEETAPAAPGRRCRDDHCYAQAAIHWSNSLGACAREVPIGVIDTDVDLRHPAFAGQKITLKSFLPEGRRGAANWHGTGVLALLAGRPDSGTPGLIPEARFFVGGIFFEGDDGESVTDTASLLRAFEWMRASGARLINMSFAGPSDELMKARIKQLSEQGIAFIAAAGNEGPAAEPSYPAAYPQVIAVTAVSKDRRIYPSASRGAYIDLAAPGVRIWTAAPGGREGYRAGTSFATPFATAVLALQRLEVLRRSKAELLRQVETVRIGASAPNPIYGRGLVQAPDECPGGGRTAAR
jgi:hypothetical protein